MGFKMRTIMKLLILVRCVGSISIFSQENQVYMSKFGLILTNFTQKLISGTPPSIWNSRVHFYKSFYRKSRFAISIGDYVQVQLKFQLKKKENECSHTIFAWRSCR